MTRTTLSNEKIIKTLAESSKPLSTTQIADTLNTPRSTTWDKLQQLQEEGKIETWKPNEQLRMWDMKGVFGDIEMTDIYTVDDFVYFMNNGVFPEDINFQEAAEMMLEALTELGWKTSPTKGLTYEDNKRLANLFNMSLVEFMEQSPWICITTFTTED